MRKSAFTEEQIALALRQAEGGTTVGGDLPQASGVGGDVLQVEEEVRRVGGAGASGAEAAQGGEPEAEAGGR